MPKQFISLVDEASTFQATARRVAHGDTFSRPTVITSADTRFIVAEQLLEAGVSADILLEPTRRDSAAAVAAAACYAASKGPTRRGSRHGGRSHYQR
jgi:mannose-1-phosphate guanylyltransferase/mannose-6-phosphate isomerase